MRSCVGPYLLSSACNVGCTRAQNGHCKSENSTMVTGALASPHTASSLPTGSGSELGCCTCSGDVASCVRPDGATALAPGTTTAGGLLAPPVLSAQPRAMKTKPNELVRRDQEWFDIAGVVIALGRA